MVRHRRWASWAELRQSTQPCGTGPSRATGAKLKAEGYEHEVRFARLHEQRVEVIAGLYQAILEAEGAFNDWTHPAQFVGQPSREEKFQIAMKAGKSLRAKFRESRIWLDEDLCERVAALEQTLYRAFVDFTTYDPDNARDHAAHHAGLAGRVERSEQGRTRSP